MAGSARYVVTQPFTISYERNGTKQGLDVSRGDVVEFDGVNFRVGDVSGPAPSLRAVVKEGEWLHLEDGSEPQVFDKPPVQPTRTYNATGGTQIEMSDPAADRDLYRGRQNAQPEKTLGETVREFEEGTEKADTTIVTDDMSDIRKEVKIETMDVREVARVRGTGPNAATSSAGIVTTRKASSDKHLKVEQGTTMAKQTAPNRGAQGYKHLKVDQAAAGVEVSKVSDRSDSTMRKQASEGDKRPVVSHQTVVKKTSRPASTKTDVSSSTQAAVEKMKQEPAAAPEVTVVGTVRDEFQVASKDGIKSTMTVRASDDMSEGTVTSSSAEGGVELSGGDDLDVGDLLAQS